MNALPIVRRELLVLSRRRWFPWLRAGVGAAIALVSCVVFAMTTGATTYQGLGAPLFTTVAVMSFFVCLLAGPVLLADSIAEEKRAGTLGLLFLTNTRGPDIVGGKFVAFALPALHCLLASLPVLAVAFFLGGVSAGEFARTAAALLNVLLFSLAAAVLCSVLARSGRSAFGASLLLVLACGVGGPALLAAQVATAPALRWLVELLGSPGLAWWTANDAVFATNPGAFRTALAVGHGLGWLCLTGAVLAVPRCWREKTDPAKAAKPSTRRPARSRTATKNPLGWLARRQLGGTAPAWLIAVVTALTVGWLTRAAMAGHWDYLIHVLAAYALHGVFKLWVGWVSSRAFGPERDSGALELLLITPMGESALWRAWLAGLRRRFLIPALALVAGDLLIVWFAAMDAPDGSIYAAPFFLTLMGAVVFLFDCYALSWSGLWNGLAARNATRAGLRSMLPLLLAPGLVFSVLAIGAAQTGGLDEESLIRLAVGWSVVSFVLDLIFAVLAMTRLSHDCREAAVRARGG
jgi:ABC-type transport system involved in multi-copper enzyme maturation permease subunit